MFVRNTVSLAMARLNMILAPKAHQPQDNIDIDTHTDHITTTRMVSHFVLA